MNGFNYGPYQDYSGYYGAFPDGEAVVEGMLGGMMGAALGILLVMLLVMLALCVGIYIFQAVSLYTIAKRRQISNPWLAWLPWGNSWILGSISDQYRYVAKGQVTNRRRILLILSLLPAVVGLVPCLLADNPTAAMAMLMVAYAVTMVLAVVHAVFFYMALYDVYCSCNPDNAVLALVFSVLFSITQPFFLFACRRQDAGMPPRRQEQPRQIPNPTFYGDPGEEPAPEENS